MTDTSGGTPPEPPTTLPDNEELDFEQWISSVSEGFKYDNSTADPDPNAEETEDEESLSEEPPDGGDVEPPLVEPIDVDGEEVSRDELIRLYKFGKQIEASAPAPTPVVPTIPTYEPQQAPDTLDLDNPQIKFIWEQLQEVRKQAWDTEQIAQGTQASTLAQRAEADVTSAIQTFRTKYPSITDEDIQSIRVQAGALIPGLLATHKNPVEAMDKSLYIASLEREDIRNKILGITPTKMTSKQRKQKQSSLSGTSGSVPRNAPPRQPASHREAIDEFAQQLESSGFFNGN